MRGAQTLTPLADAFEHNTSKGVAMTTITQMMNAYPASVSADTELFGRVRGGMHGLRPGLHCLCRCLLE
jgi:hypothetical protein